MMKNDRFDRLLSAIRDQEIPETVVTQASERVWKSIAGDVTSNPQSLRTCDDFQALIPAYLAKQLVPARWLLVEDHLHACVACRHALERTRVGETQPVWRLESKRPSWSAWRWATGAAAAAAVVVAAFAISNGLFPGQHPVRAAVQSVDGSLYAIEGDNMRIISAGYEIRNGDEVRTAKGSTEIGRAHV